MGDKDLNFLKNNLEAHILRCNKMLDLLVSDSITPEHLTEVNLILDLIKYEKSQTISSMGEQRNFIELINGVPSVAIQGYNTNRELIYWNKASELIYGYTYSEAIGKKLEQLIIPEEMQSAVVVGINNWFQKGVAIPAGELVLQRKDLSPIHVFSSHIMLGEGTDNPEMFCIDVDLSEIAALKDANTNLEKQAHFDKLTNIYNRHYFDTVINKKLSQMIIQKKDLSLIMFDIDFFKLINDQFGHDVGDKALVELIRIVKAIIREDDVFIRWGGEEFILLLEADKCQAIITAEKLRLGIETNTSKSVDIPSFTCSFGVVSMQGFSSFEDAYKLVDEKLYLAKNRGRNRVEA